MCGIAGELNCKGLSQNKVVYEEMLNRIRHRGPDTEGVFYSKTVALVHSRLVVVDKENGKQPMIETIEGKNVILVYNGELYNTDELRQDLKLLGTSFRGHSDTEVVLKSYLAYGKDCVKKMNGIFAFAIMDERNNQLFIARDRLGVKPLFYFQQGDCFLFASEIKALLAHPFVRPVVSKEAIIELFTLGPARIRGTTPFKDVMELLPGEIGLVQDGHLDREIYWQLSDKIITDDFESMKQKVRALVIDATERQLVSDVPVCTFLSGGLDSSILSVLAANKLKEKGLVLDTISVEYLENEKYFQPSHFQPNRDEYYVGLVQQTIQSNHHSISLSNEELAIALKESMKCRDIPGMADVDSSLYLFSKEIKKVATVALSGECADEIFGGYPWFYDEDALSSNVFPWSQNLENRLSYLKDEFIIGNEFEKVKDLVKKTRESAPCQPGLSQKEIAMKQMMKLNLDWFMQTLLERKDRMSMAFGLEVRVPFCDYRLVEFLYQIPWEIKNYKNREKGLLREAFSDLLPEEIVWRKKSPYPKTHHPSYTRGVKEMLNGIIENQEEPIHQFVNKERLESLLVEQNSMPWFGQLMTTPQTMAYFVQINEWLKEYKIIIEDCV